MITARFIEHKASDGSHNMAVDEALLKSVAEGSPATLRFYGWSAPTLSLGYFQIASERSRHPDSLNCELVRRASGGGAILHEHELTYSFATPARGKRGAANDLYLTFHESLIKALSDYGISAKLHAADDGISDAAFLCFQRRADGDVVLDGKKIMGSAQRRWRTAILQHGSLLLNRSRHAPELPGLRELSQVDFETEALLRSWRETLARRLNLEFQIDDLTDREEREAATLNRDKFRNPAWTQRR
jgi:lipoate-protein ligase A